MWFSSISGYKRDSPINTKNHVGEINQQSSSRCLKDSPIKYTKSLYERFTGYVQIAIWLIHQLCTPSRYMNDSPRVYKILNMLLKIQHSTKRFTDCINDSRARHTNSEPWNKLISTGKSRMIYTGLLSSRSNDCEKVYNCYNITFRYLIIKLLK